MTKTNEKQEMIDFTARLLDQMESLERQVAGYKADAMRYRALVSANELSEEYMNSLVDEYLEEHNEED